ncbi:hypothetical protein JQ557_12475 [Bradyrhizobium sp. U87765 SZCCT0131]|uniref:hypothetical protein n=1 Tax=unclassified Bradyrhizobium TaxID=2631580 RepID=UPI001BA68B21|nr:MULTISPECIES: hypothetical protein [unclassified Bradyrhizobium]MBR1218809.1 hypothetical protein [Bradyrhizobium sp. U87765 SZCCT0131]MBR1261460.1 hypothetical protein [Bradyrhizobium sp. U87765 SZCCT0134]MBR1306687.1 hypothetical protein [Bradyrhizobium sp. U87765 SZCCT0110]MBR1317242.1 hypothetical protein [Bradyrhizobium sp. U87765 SZCCT0109]MBR1350944.1 hypothetical protein [Bradyrhizobium sp. U87765 SZCCT0048]
MDLVIFLLAILLWWGVEALTLVTPSILSHYLFGLAIAILAFHYWIPTIAVAAISEFAFSFLPKAWRGFAYLGFALAVLAILSPVAHNMFGIGPEQVRLLLYPAIAVAALYVVRSFARQHD